MPARKFFAVAVIVISALQGQRSTAASPEEIKKAIETGRDCLKRLQQRDGSWLHEHRTGGTALATLALLECDVDSKDPAVVSALNYLRPQVSQEARTYEISLLIWVFDRLGDPQDEALIATLADRLLRGQNANYGWTYYCPVPQSQATLPGALQPSAQNDAGGQASPGVAPRPAFANFGEGDNSNTQFATLALWVARRHKQPVDETLTRAEKRFRAMQHPDGGWGYTAGATTTPPMTCAGLLGLGIGHGVADDSAVRTDTKRSKKQERAKPKAKETARDPSRDPAVRAGLVILGRMIAGPFADAHRTFNRGPPPGVPRGPGAALPPGLQGQLDREPDPTDYYFLWSLERVGMVYGLKTLAKNDWYQWGADLIVRRQRSDGGWQGNYEKPVDTSFALLFLRRSNLASDLTTKLKGKVEDPGEVKLKAGGVGEDLPGRDASANRPPVENSEPKEGTGSIPKLKIGGEKRAGNGRSTPPAEDSEVGRLTAELVQASQERQEALIDKLRDNRGVVNTQALAMAIPQLTGSVKTKARDALAERLTRMTNQTLKDKLQDDDPEIRRAAALACALKEEKSFVPELIKLLDDEESLVQRAAHAALKRLTKQDLGPAADASPAQRAQAIIRWKDWWSKNK
jgi:HEAT repeats/Prenyltransferase and squalene oxidase repeat